MQRSSGQWRKVTGMPDTSANDYHAVHVDDQGGVWVTVGDVITLGRGALIYYGTRTVPTIVLRQAKLRERVQPILYATCATTGCHIPPYLSEGLDLSSAQATRATVGTASAQSPLLPRPRGSAVPELPLAQDPRHATQRGRVGRPYADDRGLPLASGRRCRPRLYARVIGNSIAIVATVPMPARPRPACRRAPQEAEQDVHRGHRDPEAHDQVCEKFRHDDLNRDADSRSATCHRKCNSLRRMIQDWLITSSNCLNRITCAFGCGHSWNGRLSR